MATEPNSGVEVNFDWEKTLEEGDATPEMPGGTSIQAREKDKESKGLPNLSLLLDIPLEITAELGRTKMIIHDLLQLGQGSVIELNKLAGEPLEILVSNKLIARGEVVVVNEKFGIRLTDIISPMERIKQLA